MHEAVILVHMIRKLRGGALMKELVKRTNVNGLTVHVLPTKKFKTVQIVLKFRAPLDEETITKRALLPYVLRKGTKKYPTEKELQTALDQLYGAVFSIDGAKKGNDHILSVRLEIANEKYIPQASHLLTNGMKILNEIIFNPLVVEDGFDEKTFIREKKTLSNRIEAIIDDKMAYANLRLIDEMCADESYRLRVHGDEQQLKALDHFELYTYYKKMIELDQCDLYIVGDVQSDTVTDQIKNIFPSLPSSQHPKIKEKEELQKVEEKEIIDKQDIQQAKLHIGYRTHCTYKDEEYFALQVFNGLFGGFPNSKLFLNVREKHSLAYYAASRLESLKGLMIVVSGIDSQDYEQARSIIEDQLEAMKNGEFSADMLSETKEMITNQFLETLDNPQGMIEVNYQQVLGSATWTLDMFIERIRKVTKQEVIDVAKKIEQDTVYLLTSGGSTHA